MLGTLPREERPAYGQAANEVKEALESAFAERQEALKAAVAGSRADRRRHRRDAARPPAAAGTPAHHHADAAPDLRHLRRDGLPGLRGAGRRDGRHTTSACSTSRPITRRGICGIRSGSARIRTPDAADERLVMRTHTSPGQIRAMRERYPEPIRVILPGKCYRYEQITGALGAPVLPGRGAGGRTWDPDDRPDRHAAAVRRRRCTAPDAGCGCAAATSRSPSRASRPTWTASLRRQGLRGLQVYRLAGDRRAPAWSIRWCCATAATIRPSLLGLRLRLGRRAAGDDEVRHQGHPLLLRNDLRFLAAVRLRMGGRR